MLVLKSLRHAVTTVALLDLPAASEFDAVALSNGFT